MDKIVIKDFNMGGVSDSIHSGIKNSLASLVGFDIHSEAGLLTASQAMAKISGSTITEFCKAAVDCSNGNKYWFSADSGKIWKQTSSDVFSLLHTTTPAAGEAKCLGAMEYNGRVYFATQSRLHYIDVATEAVTEDFATFTNTNATFHPMRMVNLVLYIGDGDLVAQVDDTTFTANALDIPSGYIIQSLGQMNTELLIGAYIGDNINRSTIFRWNTWSTSFTNADDVPEEGIWAFLEADNYVLVAAGLSGNIYYYNMQGLEMYKTVQGNYTQSAEAKIYPQAVGAFKGSRFLFGVSNVNGTPTKAGIWELGRHSRNYPLVLDLPFPISQLDGDGYNITGAVEIGAILVSGTTVYCSWKDSTSTPAYGVDKLDWSNKIEKPYLETRVMIPDNAMLTPFNKFMIGYKDYPANTSIVVKVKNNYASSWPDALTEVKDSIRNLVTVDGDRLEARTLQLRVEFDTDGNNSPSIDEVAVLIN